MKIFWRRGWDSNPRARFWQARRFRGAPVMTASVPLREKPSYRVMSGTRYWRHDLDPSSSVIPFPDTGHLTLDLILSFASGKTPESPKRIRQPEYRSLPRPGDSACGDSAPASADPHAPALGSRRAEHHAPQSRLHDGAGAHRTRFNCNIQVAALQPVVAQLSSRRAAAPEFPRARKGRANGWGDCGRAPAPVLPAPGPPPPGLPLPGRPVPPRAAPCA